MDPQPVAADQIIAEMAARQHRVVARRQLLAAGITADQIRVRIARHQLLPLHRGVYAVAVPDPGRLGRLLAAVLAVGEDAALSHRSAAVHHGLLRHRAEPVDVIVPRRRGSSRRAGIRLHCSPSLLPYSDTTRRHGIPCTTVERTLIDTAASNPTELSRAVEQAFVKKLIGRTRMAEALERATGQPGTQRLRRELAGLLPQLPFTRSELERRFLRLLKTANLPTPVVNRREQSHRVDFHWPAQQPGRRNRRPWHPRQPLHLRGGPRPRPRPRARRHPRDTPLLASGHRGAQAGRRAARHSAQRGSKRAVK